MNEEKVCCEGCGVNILQETFTKCNGLCMPCFMKQNAGFKPDELSLISERGLMEFWKEWKDFLYNGAPDTGDEKTNDELSAYASIIAGSINLFFRSSHYPLDGEGERHALSELQTIGQNTAEVYIRKLCAFYNRALDHINPT